eukprot:11150758-Ditylum_brightwellii.AAC.1
MPSCTVGVTRISSHPRGASMSPRARRVARTWKPPTLWQSRPQRRRGRLAIPSKRLRPRT